MGPKSKLGQIVTAPERRRGAPRRRPRPRSGQFDGVCAPHIHKPPPGQRLQPVDGRRGGSSLEPAEASTPSRAERRQAASRGCCPLEARVETPPVTSEHPPPNAMQGPLDRVLSRLGNVARSGTCMHGRKLDSRRRPSWTHHNSMLWRKRLATPCHAVDPGGRLAPRLFPCPVVWRWDRRRPPSASGRSVGGKREKEEGQRCVPDNAAPCAGRRVRQRRQQL